jgi:Protein of unknown function (DUF3551)
VRTMLFVLGIVVGSAAIGAPAKAQNYPWCAYYGGGSDDGGGTNCGFTTFDQCMATVSGIGGFCMRNTMYQASGPAPPARARKRYPHS